VGGLLSPPDSPAFDDPADIHAGRQAALATTAFTASPGV
jgi:hypothetical protein